ncbi:MAG: hypothetical protein ACE5J7_02520 [Candidatus Aenigmatarchaeota archaeon]
MSEEGVTEEIKKEERKFMKWLKGSDRKEYIENMSYVIMFISAFFIFLGLGLGSFVPYFVYLAAFGSFLLLVGIAIYIASQLIEEKSTGSAQSLARSSGEI